MGTKAKTTTRRLPAGIARFGESLYRKGQDFWTAWMQQKAAGLTHRQLFIILCVFSISTGTFSLLRLYQGLTGTYKVNVEAGRVSPVIQIYGRVGEPRNTADAELLKIRAFRKYMDSLSLTPEGLVKRDSIIVARPGLFDSVASIEAHYALKLNK